MNILGSDGEALMKAFETLALTAYLDEGNIWTIGWGHTGIGVVEGLTCTLTEADTWFNTDTQFVVSTLDRLLATSVTQNQFDALVSFTYNVGIGAEQHSTLMRLVNQRNFMEAALEFPRWHYVNHKESRGLLRRRIAEQALFLGKPWQNVAVSG